MPPSLAKSEQTVETANSWILPESERFRREPDRPKHLRIGNFEADFDFRTVFYNCFRISSTQAMLIGPPLNKFEGVLDSLTIHSGPGGAKCHYQVHHKARQCRVVVDVPETETSLRMQCAAGETVLEIQPNSRDIFKGRRVLFTHSKNNDPMWICDWMRFHRDLQNVDAILLYDNGSTAYTAKSLLEIMKQVSGFTVISVVDWPYKFGPQGINGRHWDSYFCQDGALEDARWRYLSDAKAVLCCDIDELVLSDDGTVIDKVIDSGSGCVKFHGRWVNAPAKVIAPARDQKTFAEVPPRHRDSTYQLPSQWRWKRYRPKDINLCPTKYAVVPGRCPVNAQWSIHEVLGMQARKLSLSKTCYRHFRQISTNWKYRRTDSDSFDPSQYKNDVTLQEAFAKVRWDV